MLIEHELHIEAPPGAVWAITIDVERWPEWTRTCTSVERLDEGPFGLHSGAMIKQPGLPRARWVVTDYQPDRRFTWESHIRGIQMIATHEVSASGSGTRSVLRLELSGIVARLLAPILVLPARRSLERENQSLKARCEG